MQKRKRLHNNQDKKMKKSTLQKFATWYTKKAQTKHLTNQALERLK